MARWLGWTGLVVAVGGLTLGALTARQLTAGARRSILVRRADVIVVAGAASVVFAAAASFLGPALTGLVRGGGGARALVAAMLGIALLVAVRRSDGRGFATAWPTVSLVGALLVVWALGGHAAEGGPWAVGVLLGAVHAGGVGVVAGGLVAVLAATADDAALRKQLLVALARPALVALAVVVASGLLLTGRHVQSTTALLASPYGRVLVGKVVLTLVAVALAAGQIRRSVLRADGGRATAHEWVVLGVVVLGLGVLLTAVTPAVGVPYGGAADTPPSTQTATAADLLVRMSLQPARPGPNLVELVILSTRRPTPGQIERVDVSIADPTGAPVVRSGVPDAEGRVELGGVVLPSTASVAATVSVIRPAAPVAPVDFDWTVAGPLPPHEPTVISDASLLPLCQGLALLMLGLGTATALRRRRRPVPRAARAEHPRPTTTDADAPSHGAGGARRT